MKKKLLINLFFTFLISIALTGLVFFAWYSIQTLGFEEKQGMGLLFSFLTIGQNFIIAIFTLPILFQVDNTNYFDFKTKCIYLFASPIITTIIFYFLLKGMDGKTSIAFLIPPFFFCLVSFFFYNKFSATTTSE